MTIQDPTPNALIRTFLIADVRGYTKFTVEHGDEEAARLAARFAEAVSRAVEPAGGEVVELRGDEALVSFASARNAIRAALDVQRHCAGLGGEVEQPIGVGIGLDAGEAVPVLGGYRGKALNLAARLCSLAGVGEVLASDSVTHLAGHLDGVLFTERGRVRLKGFPEPVEVVGVDEAGVTETIASEAGGAAEPKRLPIGSYLGALPAGQLVGREAERERLVAAIDAVGQRRPRAVLLAGEPGAGKTRLAQEIMLEVRNRGFVIGLGACLETRESVPYYPFLDALTGILEASSASLAEWPYLQRLAGGGSESDSDSVRAQAELDERVRREFAGFLAGVAEERPLAILLDDLHWADDSSLQLLQHLVRSLAGRPVFLLGTYRDVEVRREHPLEQVLRELRRTDLVEVLAVRRLPPEGTSALVAASFGEEEISAEFAGLVHQQTDGNPYFVQQVLRALVERGDVYRQGAGWERKELADIEIPESIRSTIGERVARLPQVSQEVLHSAAVLGSRFAFDDLVALSELDPDGLESALDAAAGAGLVRQEGNDGYAFEHAVAQQCLLVELPTRRRRRLHSRAGQVIEATPAASNRAGEIAFHYAEADEPDAAARWWLEAARNAQRLFAYSEAETHLRRAAEAAADVADPALEAEALTDLGVVQRLRGQGRDALAALERAVDAARRAADFALEARAVTELANAEAHFGEAGSAVARLEGFLDQPGDRLDSATRARALLVLSRAQFNLGRVEQMGESGAKAEAAGREAGSVALIVEGMSRRALALTDLVGIREGIAKYEEAVALSDATVPLDVLGTLHNNLAFAYFCVGDFEQHARQRRVALDYVERFAAPGQLAFAIAMCAQAETVRGNLGLATEFADRALALAEGLTSWYVGYVQTQRAEIAFQAGEFEQAEAALRSAFERAAAVHDLQLSGWSSHVLSELLTELGRHEEARRLAADFLAAFPENVYRSRTLTSLAWAEVRCGDAASAIGHAETALRDFESQGNSAEGVESLYVLGAAYSAAGRFEEADETFSTGLAQAGAMPQKWVMARLHMCQAESHLSRGDGGHAVRHLELARALIAECGFGGLHPTLDRLHAASGLVQL